jgi:hypothetical protein
LFGQIGSMMTIVLRLSALALILLLSRLQRARAGTKDIFSDFPMPSPAK